MSLVLMKGKVFGRLTVMSRGENDATGNAMWHCLCICGNTTISKGVLLRNGAVSSCGCYRKDNTIYMNTTHGQTRSVEYNTWVGMKDRCSNKTSKNYPRYGGRGIKVCDRWLNSFENFLADMGLRPSNNHSLDREKNNEDYGPDNCRWATRKEQAQNTRRNKWIEIDGRKMVIEDWAKEMGVHSSLIIVRINKLGWDPIKAVLEPSYRKK